MIFSIKSITKFFKKIDKKTWIILIFIVLLGFWIRAYTSPFTDGFSAVGWPDMTIAKWLSEGSITDYISVVRPEVRPLGYPLIVSVFYRFFGISDTLIYIINILFGTLNIFLIFLLMYMLFKKEEISLIAALFFAVDFNIIRYAVTRDSNSILFFFILLSLIFMFLSIYTGNKKLTVTTILLLSFTHLIRYEFILVSFLAVLYLLFFSNTKFPKKEFLLLIAIFLILTIPSIISLNKSLPTHIYYAFNLENSGIENKVMFSIDRIFYNVPIFFSIYLDILSNIQIFFIPILVGVFQFFKQRYYSKYKIQFTTLIVFFFLQNSINIVSFSNHRLLSLAYLPFLMIASFLIYIGIKRLSSLIHHEIKINKKIIFLILVLIFFSSAIYSALSMGKLKVDDGEIVLEVMQTLRKLDKGSHIILAGTGVHQMVEFVGNGNHIQYEDMGVNQLTNLIKKNNTIYLITYKKYFNDRLDFYLSDFSNKKWYQKGLMLKSNFKLELLESKNTIDLYQLKEK